MRSFGPGVAILEMDCSKGTYVRSLAHDIGQALGCGALADDIRRLAIGDFKVDGAVIPEQAGLDDLQPLESGMEYIPAVQLRQESMIRIRNGNAIPASGYTPLAHEAGSATPPNLYRILAPEGNMLGVGSVDTSGRLQPRKLLVG
jgi:tRNA pseudouridine55 synthase